MMVNRIILSSWIDSTRIRNIVVHLKQAGYFFLNLTRCSNHIKGFNYRIYFFSVKFDYHQNFNDPCCFNTRILLIKWAHAAKALNMNIRIALGTQHVVSITT